MRSTSNGLGQIGKVARNCGLPVSTVRYYNQMGLIDEVCKTPGGVRLYYVDNTVQKIKKIRTITHGRTLEQIKELL